MANCAGAAKASGVHARGIPLPGPGEEGHSLPVGHYMHPGDGDEPPTPPNSVPRETQYPKPATVGQPANPSYCIILLHVSIIK